MNRAEAEGVEIAFHLSLPLLFLSNPQRNTLTPSSWQQLIELGYHCVCVCVNERERESTFNSSVGGCQYSICSMILHFSDKNGIKQHKCVSVIQSWGLTAMFALLRPHTVKIYVFFFLNIPVLAWLRARVSVSMINTLILVLCIQSRPAFAPVMWTLPRDWWSTPKTFPGSASLFMWVWGIQISYITPLGSVAVYMHVCTKILHNETVVSIKENASGFSSLNINGIKFTQLDCFMMHAVSLTFTF